MPASAHHPGDQAPEAGARVIDFASRAARRSSQPREAVVELDEQSRRIVRVWQEMMGREGLDLTDPVVAATMRAVGGALERLVFGMQVLRDGDPERGIVGSPDAGLGPVEADLVRDVLREMASAPERVGLVSDAVREL